MLRPDIHRLDILLLPHVPEMQPVPVTVPQQIFRNQAILELRGLAPFAAHQHIFGGMPPEIVGEILGAAVVLPGAEDVEIVMVQEENPSRSLAPVGWPQGVDIDGVRTAVHGVRTAVARLAHDLLGLDDASDARVKRVGLGIHDVEPELRSPGMIR